MAAESSEPEVIYHLATTRADPATTMQVNVDGLDHLLEATRRIDYERFVVASSSLVYGKRDRPLAEDCEIRPAEFFGESKASAEALAQEFARSTEKPIAILRLFSVYGDWEDPARLISTAILAALTGSPMRLTSPGLRRDLVFVHDVAEALCLAAGNASIAPGDVINVGSGVQTANEDTVRMIEEACGEKITIVGTDYPPRRTDKPHWVADTSKAERILGWKARTPVREGIVKTVEWMRGHLAAVEAVAR